MNIPEQLAALEQQAAAEVGRLKTLGELELLEIRVLGRKGELTGILRGLAEVSAEDRPKIGAQANETKVRIENFVKEARFKLESSEVAGKLDREWADVTEPGTQPPIGHLHLMTQAINEITDIFSRAGFIRVRYPEVEWDWYAFESLNMPKDHPARDDWETYFIDSPTSEKWGRMLLTPHTSNSQVRELKRHEFPVRMLNIAKCYRRQMDATHAPMFHQFEGLLVDKGVNISHLRGILDYFAREFFGPGRTARIRPHHFRFTEPSFEVDFSCGVCNGTGLVNKQKCKLCKRGWLEVGGAGMVHPKVLKAANIDPSVYSGFAFGWGIERTYMMKEGLKLDDIRPLYKNDLRFLEQF